MNAISIALLVGLAARVAAADVKRIREITINQKRGNEVHRVAVAVGHPAQIDFPEPFASPPVRGDCGPTGLFKIEVLRGSLTIKPRRYPGPQPDGTLEAGLKELQLTINELEGKHRAMSIDHFGY